MNTTVRFQSPPLAIAFNCSAVQFAPSVTFCLGCSLREGLPSAYNHDTAGSLPLVASWTNRSEVWLPGWVLPVREQLIVRMALFSGMRPSEIFALQWKHIADDHVEVVHRIYRGKLDRPKSERSKRTG